MKHRPVAASLLLALILPACGSGRARPAGRAPLPADSAAVLDRALKRARPAFPTQEEAIRSGAYRGAVAAADPPPTRTEPAPPPPVEAGDAADAGSRFVIQVAAFRDLASAERLAHEAREAFGDLRVRVEADGGLFRVALAGWPTALEAEWSLRRIRSRYPGAWVREGPVP